MKPVTKGMAIILPLPLFPITDTSVVSNNRVNVGSQATVEAGVNYRTVIQLLPYEVNNETNCNEIVLEMIKERAATGCSIKRPTERMLHKALLVFLGRNLPKLLDADTEFRHIAYCIE